MTRDTFLLAFVLAAAVLAGWVAFRLPGFGPQTLRGGWVNLALALVLGALLTPIMNLVPGQPDTIAVMVALIGVAAAGRHVHVPLRHLARARSRSSRRWHACRG